MTKGGDQAKSIPLSGWRYDDPQAQLTGHQPCHLGIYYAAAAAAAVTWEKKSGVDGFQTGKHGLCFFRSLEQHGIR
jgi:hypothetical protein